MKESLIFWALVALIFAAGYHSSQLTLRHDRAVVAQAQAEIKIEQARTQRSLAYAERLAKESETELKRAAECRWQAERFRREAKAGK